MTDPHDSDDPGGPEVGADPWPHLRLAALELIAAGRSFLDAADAAVRSEAAPTVLRDLTDLGREAAPTVLRDLADLGRDIVARAAQAADDQREAPSTRPSDDYVDIPLDD
jgi:hypothetical protein